jgi:hypothetical protein
MYALIKNGKFEKYPYLFSQLQADNPQTSFPAEMTGNLLAEWGLVSVAPTFRPEEDHTKTITEGQPQLVDGQWVQVWVVEDAPAEVIAARTAERAAEVRQERNALLSSCDWTQLNDTQVDRNAWASYRQALRDVPKQAGFPWNVDWPIAPK